MGRAISSREPARRSRRHAVRRRHVPRHRAGADLLDRFSEGLHRRTRSAAAGAPRTDLADRSRHDEASTQAVALEGDTAAAGRGVVASERLVARHGAAAAGAARRRVCCAAIEAARRADHGLARQAPRVVDPRRPERDRARHRAEGARRQVAGRARGGGPPVGALAQRGQQPVRRAGVEAGGRSELDRPPAARRDRGRAPGGVRGSSPRRCC